MSADRSFQVAASVGIEEVRASCLPEPWLRSAQGMTSTHGYDGGYKSPFAIGEPSINDGFCMDLHRNWFDIVFVYK